VHPRLVELAKGVQIFNLLYRGFPIRRASEQFAASAGYKPAIRQIENLRYAVCALDPEK
jgi:hypothetical protein